MTGLMTVPEDAEETAVHGFDDRPPEVVLLLAVVELLDVVLFPDEVEPPVVVELPVVVPLPVVFPLPPPPVACCLFWRMKSARGGADGSTQAPMSVVPLDAVHPSRVYVAPSMTAPYPPLIESLNWSSFRTRRCCWCFDVHTPSGAVQASPVELVVENEAELIGGEHPDVVVPIECDQSRNGETEEDATESDPLASPFEG